MNISTLSALLGLLACGAAVAAPPVAGIQLGIPLNKSMLDDPSDLKVSVIGNEIQLHRDKAASSFKSNVTQRASGTLVISRTPFAKVLASRGGGNSVAGASVAAEIKRASPIGSGDLAHINHVSASNKIFSEANEDKAFRKHTSARYSATLVPTHPVRKN